MTAKEKKGYLIVSLLGASVWLLSRNSHRVESDTASAGASVPLPSSVSASVVSDVSDDVSGFNGISDGVSESLSDAVTVVSEFAFDLGNPFIRAVSGDDLSFPDVEIVADFNRYVYEHTGEGVKFGGF